MSFSLPRIGLLSLFAATAGCRVSASAEGKVNTSGESNSSASVAASTEEAPSRPIEARSIEYKQGKLEYSGIINFEYDKADLKKDADTAKTLSDFAAFLKDHPDVTLQVEGHTDSRGSDDYNLKLSERRAQALRQWLIAQGIDSERLTAVGKGETAPQVPEPEVCHNTHPADPKPCDEAWQKNRRVVFGVTGGGKELEKEQVAPAPAPAPAPAYEPPVPVVESKPKCPWLWGPHVNPLGPNSWVTVAGATQPGVCWLELSLGVGLGLGSKDASVQGVDASADYWSLTFPLRARIWFMDRHSLLGDVGLGLTHYDIEGKADNIDLNYERNSNPFIGHLGLGYGYRPNGAQAGWRVAIMGGLLIHLSDLASSSATAGLQPLQTALDNRTDTLTDLEPYGELSFGWLF